MNDLLCIRWDVKPNIVDKDSFIYYIWLNSTHLHPVKIRNNLGKCFVNFVHASDLSHPIVFIFTVVVKIASNKRRNNELALGL